MNAIRDLGLLAIFGTKGTESDMYARAWVITLPILMSVQVATAFEAYTKLTGQYAGLGVFGSKLLSWCLLLLVPATCISVAWDSDHFVKGILEAVLFTYRYIAFVLAGCLALPCLLLWRFPKPNKQPARNIAVQLWMLVAYFCVYMLSFLSVNVVGIRETKIHVINVITLLILCGLYGSWAFVLKPAGEASVQWPKLSPDLVARIDARTDATLQHRNKLRRSGRT